MSQDPTGSGGSDPSATGDQPRRAAESRWPMAIAVLMIGALHATLPKDFTAAPGWIFQVTLLICLVAQILGDPGRIDRQRPSLRLVTEVMITIILLANAVAAVRLVIGILENASFSQANDLLRVGGVVWVTNVLTFALLYWELDGGGAAARASGTPTTHIAFVFPEHGQSDRVEPGWYPQFVDYLALSFNTAMAFSPTDVSAIRQWSKLALMAESAISLLVALLVIARAINVLPT